VLVEPAARGSPVRLFAEKIYAAGTSGSAFRTRPTLSTCLSLMPKRRGERRMTYSGELSFHASRDNPDKLCAPFRGVTACNVSADVRRSLRTFGNDALLRLLIRGAAYRGDDRDSAPRFRSLQIRLPAKHTESSHDFLANVANF